MNDLNIMLAQLSDDEIRLLRWRGWLTKNLGSQAWSRMLAVRRRRMGQFWVFVNNAAQLTPLGVKLRSRIKFGNHS